MKDSTGSSTYGKMIGILAILLGALLIFGAGVAVGYSKAVFSRDWDDSYAGRFARPGSPFMPASGGDDMPNPHGAYGEVVAIHLPVIVIKGPEEAEKSVVLDGQTGIRRFHDPATSTDIMLGDTVVVIGEPDGQGQVHASFLRIVPQQMQASSTGI